MHRKSQHHPRIGDDIARSEHWPDFATRLRGARTVADAAAIVADAPPPDSPDRSFYTNLGYLLGLLNGLLEAGGGTLSAGASLRELRLYADAAKQWPDIDPTRRATVVAELELAIARRVEEI